MLSLPPYLAHKITRLLLITVCVVLLVGFQVQAFTSKRIKFGNSFSLFKFYKPSVDSHTYMPSHWDICRRGRAYAHGCPLGYSLIVIILFLITDWTVVLDRKGGTNMVSVCLLFVD